ncbi:hypothetical protein IWX90DRAFT_418279 [Phyllosticta citrichinensis]|uniref:Uncharacterized protein n=1 Tax=Phyllosticta citrichinensis TaxID=1130410 RepID=A0ABR1XI91_9PEZI
MALSTHESAVEKGISENLVPSPTPFKADYELQAKTGCNREQPTAPSLIHRCLARLHPMVLIHIPLVLETSRGGAVHRNFPFQSEKHISKDSGSSHRSAMHRERLENPRHKREEREQRQQSYQDSRMTQPEEAPSQSRPAYQRTSTVFPDAKHFPSPQPTGNAQPPLVPKTMKEEEDIEEDEDDKTKTKTPNKHQRHTHHPYSATMNTLPTLPTPTSQRPT